MIIHTLWITRKGDSNYSPELQVAWDEYGLDENFEGWERECKSALEAVGSDLDEYRYINIHVSQTQVEDAFRVPLIDGEIK